MNKKQYVIIGASAAGLSATVKIRQLDPQASIVCISSEAMLYNKCLLVDYLSGQKTCEQIQFFSPEKLHSLNIHLLLDTTVVKLNRHEKYVLTDSGEKIAYDKLLIATGTRASVPPISGLDTISNCFYVHTVRDFEKLNFFVQQNKPKEIAIVGAGLTGLECADRLFNKDIIVHLIEKEQQLLSHLITLQQSRSIEHKIASHIQLYLNETITHAKLEDKIQLTFSNGKTILVDAVVLSVGVKPNSEFAKQAEIQMTDGFIVVNEYMQTNDPFIFAAGDICQIQLWEQVIRTYTWVEGIKQGVYAAQAVVGNPEKYKHILPMVKSSFFGVQFNSREI